MLVPGSTRPQRKQRRSRSLLTTSRPSRGGAPGHIGFPHHVLHTETAEQGILSRPSCGKQTIVHLCYTKDLVGFGQSKIRRDIAVGHHQQPVLGDGDPAVRAVAAVVMQVKRHTVYQFFSPAKSGKQLSLPFRQGKTQIHGLPPLFHEIVR